VALSLGLFLFAQAVSAAGTGDVSLSKEVERYIEKSASVDADPSTFRVFWKDGLKFETGDGNFSMHIGGRLMWDSFWMSSDDFSSSDVDTTDGTFFRRVRLEVAGTAYKNTIFKVQVDFAKGNVVLKDVYMGLKKLGRAGTLKAGHFKEPFGLEELTSSKYMTFIERAQGFAPSRNSGIGVSNAAFDKRLFWALGIFRTTNDQGADRKDGGYAFTVRLAGIVVHDKERGLLVHVGVGFSFRDVDSVRYRFRPGPGTGDRSVDTGSIASDDVTLAGFELAAVWRSLSVQFELMLADVNTPGGSDPQFLAWYVQVSYFITGESRRYKKGSFGRVKPKKNFHDGGGGLGAWEVAVRFDTADLNDSGVTGGQQDLITGGVNWHWNPNARVMLNVVHADVSGTSPSGTITSVIVRFQFDF